MHQRSLPHLKLMFAQLNLNRLKLLVINGLFKLTVPHDSLITHCVMMSCGGKVLGQHWLRKRLLAGRHQIIPWTNVDQSSLSSCAIYPMELSHKAQYIPSWYEFGNGWLMIAAISAKGPMSSDVSNAWEMSIKFVGDCIMMLMKFSDLSQSDRSNWIMWQVKDPCPRPGWDGCLTR